MGRREVPIGWVMHPELRDERSDRYRWAERPTAAVVLQASPLAPDRIAVIGTSDVSQCLHSVTVIESPTEVLIRAFVGHDTRSGRSSEFDYVVRRVLWVTEVELESPLGSRAVMTDALSEASPGDYDCLPIHGSHAV